MMNGRKNHNSFRDIYFQFSSCHFLLFALFETYMQEPCSALTTSGIGIIVKPTGIPEFHCFTSADVNVRWALTFFMRGSQSLQWRPMFRTSTYQEPSSNRFLTASHPDLVQTQSECETRLQDSHQTVSWWWGESQSMYPWSCLNFHNIVCIWILNISIHIPFYIECIIWHRLHLQLCIHASRKSAIVI
jgi:hypothetical protein